MLTVLLLVDSESTPVIFMWFVFFKGVPTESKENRVSEWLQGNLNDDGPSQMRVEYVLVETFHFQIFSQSNYSMYRCLTGLFWYRAAATTLQRSCHMKGFARQCLHALTWFSQVTQAQEPSVNSENGLYASSSNYQACSFF